jgi:hypothetical protein
MQKKRMQSETIQTQGLLESRSTAIETKNPGQFRNPKIMAKQGKEPTVVQNLQKVAN